MRPLLLPLLIAAADALKILVVSPKFGNSHMNFMGGIADTLADAGHDVTVLQSILDVRHRSSGVRRAKLVEIPVHPEVKEGLQISQNAGMGQNWLVSSQNPAGLLPLVAPMAESFQKQCEQTLEQNATLEALRGEKFDVGITEQFDWCGFGVLHLLGVNRTITTSTSVIWDTISWHIGAPLVPSYVPASFSVTGDNMGFVDRVKNVIGTLFTFHFFNSFEAAANQVFARHYGASFPKLSELMVRSSLVMTNSIPLLDFPRPTLHKIIDIGGISVRPIDKVDSTLDKVLSVREKNVLFSFGSVSRSVEMPHFMRDNIVQVMRELNDTTFIWKYEEPTDTFANGVENIHLCAWVPQADLLGDKRLSAFVTHGGMGSVTESAVRGVPILAIPLFADQGRNAAMAEKHGFGIVLDKTYLADKHKLKEAIQRLLRDKEITKNAHRISSMISQQPISARDLLVKNVEFVGQFGPFTNLDPSGRHLNFFTYYLLDVAAVALLLLAALSYLAFYSVRAVVTRVLRVSPKKHKTQ